MDESSLASSTEDISDSSSSEDESSDNEAIILRPLLEPQNPEPEELNKSDLLKKVEKEDDRFKVPPKRGFKKVINPTSLYSTGDKRRKLPKIIRVPDNDERARSAKHPSELKRNKDKPLNRDKQEKVVPERIQKLAASEKSKPLVVQKNIGKTIDFKDYCRDNNIPLYGAVISDQESSVEDSEDTKSEDEGSSHIPERSEERPKLGYVPKWAELPDKEPISFASSDPAADTTIEEDCPPPEFRDEEQEEIKEEPACVAEIKEEREEQEPEESNVDKLYRMNLGLLRGLRLRIEEEGRTGKPPEPSVSKDHAGIEKLNLTREDFFEANRRVAQLYQSEKGMKSFRDLVVSQCLNEDVDMTGDSD